MPVLDPVLRKDREMEPVDDAYARIDRMWENKLIEEIFEADSAGWTITEIANDLKISRQEIIDLYLQYERYDPADPELNT